MRHAERSHWIVAAAVMTPVLLGVVASRVNAQSEFLRGDRMPYDAFDKLAKTDLDVAGGVIHVAFAPGDIALPKDKVLDWVTTSAKAVSTYYSRFPVNSLKLLIVPVDGPRVRGGTTWGYRGAAIRVLLGRDSSEDDLRRDWVMVHEMVHLALPDMEQRYNWLSEGLAVYVEPVAGTGRRSGREGYLASDDARYAERLAASRRRRPRQHRDLGADLLGRRHVLPAGRYRNPQADVEPAWPAGCAARRHHGRRQS